VGGTDVSDDFEAATAGLGDGRCAFLKQTRTAIGAVSGNNTSSITATATNSTPD
jgi:hypothetical protein